ncbi:MAG: hypothetical protein IT302_11045 [Dehalococcoidia bacterium]|nr:hypothetical protein [Dehalococcoidia bacterium]
MRLTRLIPLLAGCALFAAGAACGEDAGPAAPATEAPLTLRGEIASGAGIASPDGRLVVSTKSETPVAITLGEVRDGPALPPGWHALTPYYDVRTGDTPLALPLSLRMAVPAGGLAGVLLHDGARWRILAGERDLLSNLTATTDTGGVVVAAQPQNPKLTPTPVPVITIVPRPTATPEGDGGALIVATPTPEPSPTPTRTGGGPSLSSLAGVARSNLDPVFNRFFDRRSNQLGFRLLDGPAFLDIPPQLMAPLNARGVPVFAVPYGGVNEVLIAVTTERGSGHFVALMAQPSLEYPANASDAEATLRATFRGVSAPFAARTSASGGFAFAASQDNLSYLFGVIHQGDLVLVYALVGGGSFTGEVAAAGAP